MKAIALLLLLVAYGLLVPGLNQPMLSVQGTVAVSYTHLTLPTILLV